MAQSRRNPKPPPPASKPHTPAPSAPPPRRESPWLPALLLVAAIVFAYSPIFGASWIWDDDAYVTRNQALRSLDGLWRIWFAPGATPQYYPLTFTSFWIEYQIWGAWPAGYHAVNVLLHALNAVLVWRILAGLGAPGALAIAFVFALHPVQVESVGWITERKNVLSGFFYLASLWAYLGDGSVGLLAGAPQAAKRRSLYGVSLALFACALLSKTVTCSLPAVIVLLLWWKRERLESRDLVPLLPMFVLGVGLSGATVWMERHHVGAVGADWQLSLVERCLIAGRALWFYAGKLILPARLAFIYPRWRIDTGDWLQVLYPLAAIGVLAAAFAARHRLGRGPLVALLFFAGTLLPALGFFDVFPMRYSFVADHYQYLACLGVISLAVAGVERGLRVAHLDRGAVAVAGLAALGLAGLTWQRAHAYENAYALWNDTLVANPEAWMAHNNLGLLFQEDGDLEAARSHYEASIALKPDDDFAMNNLGNVLGAMGRPREAIEQFGAAIAANPRNAQAHNNLGSTLAQAGDLEKAKAAFTEALRVEPNYAEAHNNLANVLSMQGHGQEALAEYQEALRLDPAYAQAHHNLAMLLAANGHGDAALQHLREVVRLQPDDADANFNLGLLLAEQGQSQAAIAAVRRAVELSGKPAYRDKLAELQRGGR